jgi:hypothetical protein
MGLARAEGDFWESKGELKLRSAIGWKKTSRNSSPAFRGHRLAERGLKRLYKIPEALRSPPPRACSPKSQRPIPAVEFGAARILAAGRDAKRHDLQRYRPVRRSALRRLRPTFDQPAQNSGERFQ